MKIYHIGSCRINSVINLLNDKIKFNCELSNLSIYNTSQLINLLIDNNTNNQLLDNFFLSTNRNINFNNIDLFIFEVSTLKTLKYKNKALDVYLTTTVLKYCFNIIIDISEKIKIVDYVLPNIILLYKCNFNMQLFKQHKTTLRHNLNNKINYTKNINDVKIKLTNDLFEHFEKLCAIINNLNFYEQSYEQFKDDIYKIKSVIKCPILLIPIIPPLTNNKVKLHRLKISEIVQKVSDNKEILNFCIDKYVKIEDNFFKKYTSIQKSEIESYGKIDYSHFTNVGTQNIAISLEKFLKNLKK